jgi:V/A-type H+-transporting ATPase subunit C
VSYRLRFDTRYGFAVGRIRVLEKRFLTKQLLNRLFLASSAEEAGRILSEAGYGRDTDNVRSWNQVEALIRLEWRSALELICQLSRDPVWTDLFRKRIDFHNLRVILRERVSGESQEGLLREGGLIETETIRNAVQSEAEKSLPAFLQNTVDHFHELLDEKKNGQEIDTFIDQAEFQEWQDVLERYPNPFLKSWRVLESDLINLRTFFRLKIVNAKESLPESVWLPGGRIDFSVLNALFDESWDEALRVLGKTSYGELISRTIRQIEADQPFSQWERMCQEIRLQLIQMARNCGFGIEVLVAYFIFKEIELSAVRRIVVGRANGFSKETIEEGLPLHVFV